MLRVFKDILHVNMIEIPIWSSLVILSMIITALCTAQNAWGIIILGLFSIIYLWMIISQQEKSFNYT